MTFSKKVINILKGSKRLAILTGAVLSEESGIVTFRTPGEKFQNHDIAELSSSEGFQNNPELVWAWYQHRRRSVASKGPNKAHVAIKELGELLPHVDVMTQNVDILHQRAYTNN